MDRQFFLEKYHNKAIQGVKKEKRVVVMVSLKQYNFMKKNNLNMSKLFRWFLDEMMRDVEK